MPTLRPRITVPGNDKSPEVDTSGYSNFIVSQTGRMGQCDLEIWVDDAESKGTKRKIEIISPFVVSGAAKVVLHNNESTAVEFEVRAT